MSLATHLQRTEDGCGLQFYATIAGIPYVFGTHAQPSHWTLPDGYTWSQSLSLHSDFKARSPSIDPQMGLVSSGSVTLDFHFDPWNPAGVWPSLIAPETMTRVPLDPSRLIRPSDNRFWLADFTGFSGGTWHIGAETVIFGSFAAADGWADASERGAYGSERAWYGPKGAEAVAFGGVVEMTSWPDSWRGREVRLWAAASQWHRGVFTALSDDYRGTEDEEIFRGEVVELTVGESRATVSLDCASLVQRLNRAVLSRGRSYQAGPVAGGTGWVSLEEDGPRYLTISHGSSPYAEWAEDTLRIDVWQEYGGADRAIQAVELIGLIRGEIGTHFVDTVHMATALRAWPEIVYDENGEGTFVIEWGLWDNAHGPARFIASGVMRLHGAERQSLWPALGVYDDVDIVGSPTSRSGVTVANYQAPEPIPYYYVGPSNRWLYYRGALDVDPAILPNSRITGDPPGMQGSTRIDGQIDGVFLRLGDATIIEARMRSETGALIGDGFTGRTRAEIIRRGACGSDPVSSWVVPMDEASGEGSTIEVVIGFDQHPLLDAVRYLLCSSGDAAWPASEWNALPDGYGAGISPDVIDHEAWNRVQDETGSECSGWCINEATTGRELLELVSRALGLLVHERSTSTGIKLSLVRALAPPFSALSVAEIDADWTRSDEDAPEVTRDEGGIVNTITVRYSRDPIEDKWRSRDTRYIDANSVARYGLSDALTIDIPWIHGLADVRLAVDPVAQGVLSLWGRPQNVYEVPLHTPAALAMKPMDVVRCTLPFVPDWVSGGLGVSRRTARVMALERTWGPDDDGPFVVATLWPQSERFRYAPYVPSLAILAHVSGATYTLRTSTLNGGFADPGERTDPEWWAESATETWEVRAYLPWADNAASNQMRTVSAINLTATPPTITLSSALTGDLSTYASTVVLTFRSFAISGGLAEGQEDFVFLARAPDLSSTVNTYRLTRNDGTTLEGIRWR
jgi:hypothetical protein